MKLDHALRFVLGDGAGMRVVAEKVLPAYGADHAGRGYLMGCYAFGLEETGKYARARAAGGEGLLMAPDDAWGLHAVTHVHDMTGDAAGGLKWLSGREQAWAHCNNFRYYIWWHKALMHLDLRQYDAALDLYDTEVRKDRTDDYRDIANATSLLSRLQLDGIGVGNRWEKLADISEKRTQDGCLIFADLLALIGGHSRDAIKDLIGCLHRDAKENRTDNQKAMASPGLSAAEWLEAFGEDNYKKAFVNLARARKTFQQAGGSHAQRDVFEQLTIDCAIRAGFLEEAGDILTARTRQRDDWEDGFAAARRELIAEGHMAADCVIREAAF